MVIRTDCNSPRCTVAVDNLTSEVVGYISVGLPIEFINIYVKLTKDTDSGSIMLIATCPVLLGDALVGEVSFLYREGF